MFAGGTIVFIWAFTELGVPLIFDYTRVTSVQIFYGIKDIGTNPFPYALVVVMLVATTLIYAASKLLFARHNDDLTMMAKATSRGGPNAAGGWTAAGCVAAFSAVIFLALLPHLGVVLVSFSSDWYHSILPEHWTLDNYRTALGSQPDGALHRQQPQVRGGCRRCSTHCWASGIAYVIVRTTLPGRQVLDALAMLPLAVPGLVLAFGYLAMTQDGHIFAFLNPIKNPTPLLIIAYSVRRLPYMVRSAAAGYQQTSVTLEEAAQNLGCPPLRSLWRVTLPLDGCKPARRRVADVFVCDAGGERFALARGEAAGLSDHESDL